MHLVSGEQGCRGVRGGCPFEVPISSPLDKYPEERLPDRGGGGTRGGGRASFSGQNPSPFAMMYQFSTPPAGQDLLFSSPSSTLIFLRRNSHFRGGRGPLAVVWTGLSLLLASSNASETSVSLFLGNVRALRAWSRGESVRAEDPGGGVQGSVRGALEGQAESEEAEPWVKSSGRRLRPRRRTAATVKSEVPRRSLRL